MKKENSSGVRAGKKRPSRVRLRADCLPADPIVVELFADMRAFRQFAEDVPANDPDQKLVPVMERKAWEYLLTYLLTLEYPAWFGENKSQPK
jgi:hypothetical protein